MHIWTLSAPDQHLSTVQLKVHVYNQENFHYFSGIVTKQNQILQKEQTSHKKSIWRHQKKIEVTPSPSLAPALRPQYIYHTDPSCQNASGRLHEINREGVWRSIYPQVNTKILDLFSVFMDLQYSQTWGNKLAYLLALLFPHVRLWIYPSIFFTVAYSL